MSEQTRLPGTDLAAFPDIPGYQILDLLGEGGMGTVYLAQEVALGRKVALKVVSDRFSREHSAVERLLREARSMAVLEHPNIVRIYALDQLGSRTYFAMEYIDGELLSQRIQNSGGLPWQEALRILEEVIDALKAAWEKKIVHRDIKPSNILLDKHGRAHVADFGLAKPLNMREGSTLTADSLVLGTPHYVSPEQALGHEIDFRTDIYSLGIVLFEMLTGERPFQGNTPFSIVNKQLNSPLPSLRAKLPQLPNSICMLVDWMCQKDLHKRPSSYEELLDRIASVKLSDALSASSAAVVARPAWKALRLPWKSIGIASAVLLAMIAGTLYWKAGSPGGDGKQEASEKPRVVIAVAPFYGPDADSMKEGRVMSALVEKSIVDRLGQDVQVIGMESTATPVHDAASARALGERLISDLVIWGEAFALRNETEIQPHITVIPRAAPEVSRQYSGTSTFEELAQRPVAPLVMQTEAPNQIEIRKMSAAGISEIVQLIAGMHALYIDEDPTRALSLFEQLPRSADSLHYRARTLLRFGRKEESMQLLREAVESDPQHGQSLALLADLNVEDGNLPAARALYEMASSTGKTFETTLGFCFQRKFYIKESFRSEKFTGGQRVETAYLLEVDPDSGRVLDRFYMPEARGAFLILGASRVWIYLDSAAGHTQMEFRPADGIRLFPNGEDLGLRLQSLEKNWIAVSNFMNDLERHEYVANARFASQPPVLYNDAPTTLQELEAHLQSAVAADATQPWNYFLLAETLLAEGKEKDAAAFFRDVFDRNFPATPYYDFSYMAGMMERLGQRRYADQAFQRALERRVDSGIPVRPSKLIERLVNSNFIRQSAWASQKGVDLERQHTWLQRARQLSGPCLEGEELAASAWSRYYKGRDPQQVEYESSIVARAQEEPLNVVAASARLDYAFYLLLAVALSFPIFVLVVLSRALSEASSSQGEARLGLAPILYVLAGLVPGILLWRSHWEQLMLFASLLLLAIVWLRSAGKTVPAVVGAIPVKSRLSLAAAFVLFACVLCTCVVLNSRLQGLLERPLPAADTSGSSAAQQTHSLSNMRFWLQQFLYPGQSLNVFSAVTEIDSARSSEDFLSFFHQIMLFSIAAFFVAALCIPPRGARPDSNPRGRISFFLQYAVPGYYDMRFSSAPAGYCVFLLFLFAAIGLLGLRFVPREWPVPGVVTLLVAPDLFDSFPFPTPPSLDESTSVAAYHYWTLLFSYVHARVFWLCVGVSGVLALSLHALRIPAIYRTNKGSMRVKL